MDATKRTNRAAGECHRRPPRGPKGVGIGQDAGQPGLADGDADVPGAGMGSGVPQRLLGGSEDQLLGLGGQAQARLSDVGAPS